MDKEGIAKDPKVRKTEDKNQKVAQNTQFDRLDSPKKTPE